MKPCHTCGGVEHTEELHAAIRGVRDWLKAKLELALAKVEPGKKKEAKVESNPDA